MKKLDPVVIRETRYVALCVFLLSILTQAVFLIIGKWDYTVLLGNLLSGCVGIITLRCHLVDLGLQAPHEGDILFSL